MTTRVQATTGSTVDLCGLSLPADREGGDLIEAWRHGDDGVTLVVADAMGNGLRAAPLRRRIQRAMRDAVGGGAGPAEICRRLNATLCEALDDGRYATAFVAHVNPVRRRLRFTRAGHQPALLVRADGRVERLMTGGGLLGVFAGWTYDEGETRLARGDRLLLFTDGLVEATDEDGGELGVEALGDLLVRHRGLGARTLLGTMLEALAPFAPGRDGDDVTLGVLAVEGSALGS